VASTTLRVAGPVLITQEAVAQLAKYTPQQPGHLHLGDTQPLADLCLGHVAEEAQ
jgi:hypothetical protein